MTAAIASPLADLVRRHEADILREWLIHLKNPSVGATSHTREGELQAQCRSFLDTLASALGEGSVDVSGRAFAPVRELLAELSRSRAVQGYSPTETAVFVFSLKKPLFDRITAGRSDDADGVARDSWELSRLLDDLGLFTMEAFQRSREEVIIRQQEEIAELSTPVVRLWKGILALPLIGTLDSARTQVVMENLLQQIVEAEADIAIIDITGVPTVDTLVAQYLLKTVAAARLMGADCIISGIRPQIAQTMVHLGVELNVVSKANLADAFALALQRTGRRVVRVADRPGALTQV